MKKHPMQPVVMTKEKIVRFQENAIVRWMLDEATARGVFDLNTIARMPFDDADRMQLAQLIGYSVSGYGDLSYVSDKSFSEAAAKAEKLRGHR